MNLLLESALLTVGLALAIALIQFVLKYLSRPNHQVKLEDFVWWSEWVVTTVTGLTASILKNAVAEKPSPIGVLVAQLLVITIGCVLLPLGLRWRFCRPTGEIRTWKHAIIANLMGVACLMAAVSVGVKLYG